MIDWIKAGCDNLIPHQTCLSLPINVVYHVQHKVLWMTKPCLHFPRQSHLHLTFYRSLCIYHDKIHFLHKPAIDNGNSQQKVPWYLGGYWPISFEIILTKFLLTVKQILLAFVLFTWLVTRCLFMHKANTGATSWKFTAWNQLPMSIIHMPIDPWKADLLPDDNTLHHPLHKSWKQEVVSSMLPSEGKIHVIPPKEMHCLWDSEVWV